MNPKASISTVSTPSDFSTVIHDILAQPVAVDTATMITLSGDLGAGKTTFTQELGKVLGIPDHIVSPTFGIMKIYEIANHPDFDRLLHIDAYRIEDISEAGPLRFEELFRTPRTLICIEWPEHIEPLLPAQRIDVKIEIIEDEKRRVEICIP